jgi:hypothetical protein
MKNSSKIVFIALFFIFQDCSVIKTEETGFYVSNLTGEDISKLSIDVTIGKLEKNIYEKIDLKNGMEDYFILNKDALEKQDGGYKISFKTKSLNNKQYFGYFSNGYEGNAEYRITIKSNTFDIKSKIKSSY